jgi:hypothetical protein
MRISRFAFPVLLAASLVAGAATADPAQVEVLVGTNVICDTQQQAERYVTLFDGNAETAASRVNDEENDPKACLVATLAYVLGPDVAEARARSGSFRIVRILVLGVLTEAGIVAAVPEAFYSVLPIAERDA